MFPLAGTQIPSNSEQLASAVRAALEEVFTLPAGARTVAAEGAFPSLDRVRIDLDGATVKGTTPPPKPEPTGDRQKGITVGRLEVTGRPIRYERSQADFSMNASAVSLDYARDAAGKLMLVPTAARDGNVDVSVTKANLEAILLSAANAAAKTQGVAVQEVNVSLTSGGPRSVNAEVRVKAKKMIMSGVIRLTAKVDISDALAATVSNLSCTGEGMVGTMAAGMIQGKLKEYEGASFPLSSFSLGDLRLRDLHIETADGLRVNAAFGAGA